jgi:hypothetical protein
MDNKNPSVLYDGDYSYADSGLDSFMSRSIDGLTAPNLDQLVMNMPLWARQLPYDTMQTSGQLGDTLSVGNIAIDGVTGRISVFDADNNEVVRIGTL